MPSTTKSQPASAQTTAAAAPASISLRLLILLGFVSAVLLDFCFPVAGPPRVWQPWLAWIALLPLLWALLNPRAAAHAHYLRRAALTGYACGVLWYILNCYWIYRTMLLFGPDFPPIAAAGILVLFSAILGLYFALFGFLIAVFRRRFGLGWALALAPFLWTAIELAAARITSVPWDQLGYSQIDNLVLTRLAPWTGVYGITLVLVAANALLLAIWITSNRARRWIQVSLLVVVLAFLVSTRYWSAPPPAPTSAYAVLLQPNIQVSANSGWTGDEWHGDLAWLLHQDAQTCTPAWAGLPRPSTAPQATPAECRQNIAPPGVILWPETDSWFESDQPRTRSALRVLATTAHAPLIFGMAGPNQDTNSALFVRADGSIAGRYDKIHLVPFGEYVPYENIFFFARTLTHQLSHLHPGTERLVFRTDGSGISGTGSGHRFSAVICYESIFADEVRLFVRNGAEVLVNLSDDGWYGDTSAPWQHLEMTRMRAAENHRWLLLDTNNGVTTVIDPEGRVTLAAARHQLTSLVARYGYETGLTFYTRHGDLFAYLCCAIVLAALALGLLRRPA